MSTLHVPLRWAMGRLVDRLLVGVVLWLLVAGVAAPASGQTTAPNALVLLSCQEEAGMRQVVARIEAAGGEVDHLFPPHALIGRVPEAAARVLAGDRRVDRICYRQVEAASVPPAYGRAARDAARAWNEVFASPQPAPAPLAPGKPLVGDALPQPQPPAGLSLQAMGANAPPGASRWQTSEYLMGKVAVSVILPESTGAIDPSTEDWGADRQSLVVSEIVAGMNWWISVYPYSVARPSFTYVYHYGVPTGYEPIMHPQEEQGLWMSEVMTELGYSCTVDNYLSAINEYDNARRESQQTDWAFTIFVVDSANRTTGAFPDGGFAYGYVGGPCLVMTYGNDNWGIGRMDRVVAHETGHIFRAGDEYCESSSNCCDPKEYYGYLKVANSNCDSGVHCVMGDVAWSAVCLVTRQQLGWRDSDGDGCPDILEVTPAASMNTYSPDPTGDATPAFSGTAWVNSYPNQLYPGSDVTINRVAGVQYRVDGGGWREAAAADGGFDEGAESFTLTTPVIPTGTHTVEVRGVDSSGNVGAPPYASDTITIVRAHQVLVSAAAALTPIYSQAVTPLTAAATDELGDDIISWSWSDGGAGGSFSPSAAVQNPSYTAPVRLGSGDLTIRLTATATCNGVPPAQGEGIVELVVHDFTDVPHDQWAADAIYACYRAGMVSGYPDGSYQPDEAVTRDQMAVYLARAVAGGEDKIPDGPAVPSFPDVESDYWAYRYIEYAKGQNVVAGYPDGSYQPTVELDRGQMAVFIARAIATPSDRPNLTSYTPPTTATFPDVPTSFWSFQFVEYIADPARGVTEGYLDGKYHPEYVCTRDQMAVYLARAFKLPR